MNHQTIDKNRVAIHIGMPKTGTTSLQGLCFETHPQLNYLGQTNVWTNSRAKTILKYLITDESLSTDVKRCFESSLDDNKVLMISDEALSLGEFMLRATKWPIVTCHNEIASRIKSITEEPDIFIVLRNQADWFESWHRQGLKTAKYTETDFNRWLTHDIGDDSEHLYDLIDYEKLYEAYSTHFDNSRIHIYLFEEYSTNMANLAANIMQTLNLDQQHAIDSLTNQAKNITGSHYEGLPYPIMKLIRSDSVHQIIEKIPATIRKRLRKALSYNKAYGKISDKNKEIIMNRYRESNRRLFEKLDIDASNYGYY